MLNVKFESNKKGVREGIAYPGMLSLLSLKKFYMCSHR